MAVFTSKFAGAIRRGGGVVQRTPVGMDYLHFQVNVPTAAIDSADEQILLIKFPDDGDVFLLRDALTDLYIVPSDMDTNGSPLITFTLGIGDSDGVVDTALITDSQAARTGAADNLDAVGAPLDVSGKYLIFDVTAAAATAAAGTLGVRAKVLYGKRQEVDSGIS